ncbi:MAG: hypothetical protein AB1344_00195 [Pseudomonadota bacterium]
MRPTLAQATDQAALTQTLLKRAEAAPRGSFPRPFHGEQAYWTVIGEPDSTHAALLSEDGLLEPWPGGPALEPFLHLDGRRLGWAEVRTEQRLEDGDLPLPTTTWRADTLRLEVSAVATREAEHPLLLARYRVINADETEQAARLELSLRPLQVYPPWLQLAVAGGASPIHRLALTEDALLVNDEHRILALSPPTAIETTAPPPAPQLREPPKKGATPTVLVAENGLAGATWHYALSLAPGEQRDIILAFPFTGAPDPAVLRSGDPAELFERHLARQRECWRLQLDRVTLSLPTPEGETLAQALRSSLAYMLIHSPRPLIRPGSRGYARAWMRDGALMAHAFLQLGHDARARAFLRWYAPMQQPDGGIPCCVDDLGPDPTLEHDSHGEFIHLLAEIVRHTGDDALARELWPAARRAAEHLIALRARRLTPEYDTPALRRFRGLLPESASHEGYLQNPVHSYWDDFFALRGLKDAAWLAQRLGDAPAARRYRSEYEAMRADVAASIRQTMQDKGLTTIPASADLGDFDPTSTAIALSPTQEDALLPGDALRQTFDQYLAMVRERAAGSPRLRSIHGPHPSDSPSGDPPPAPGARVWPGYTPYEWRNVEALVRLGRNNAVGNGVGSRAGASLTRSWRQPAIRDTRRVESREGLHREEAWELLRLLFADRRPLGWNAWPEVIWADPRRPDYIGDMPHGWVAGEFIRAVLSLIVHTREADQTLVIGAGLPPEWLDSPEGLHVHGLSTPHGRLNLDIDRVAADMLLVRIGGTLRAPSGGVLLDLPLKRQSVSVDGEPFRAAGQAIKLTSVPAIVLIRHAPPAHPAPRSP